MIDSQDNDIATPLLPEPAPKKPGSSTPSIIRKLINLLYRRPFFQRLTQLVEEQYDAERAKKDFELSRPPKGVTLELRSVRLMELFQIEDLGRLQRGVIDLFPGIEHDLNVRSTIQSLLNEAGDIFLNNAHWNVGYVARTKLFFGRPFRSMTNLPDEISHVDVGVIKFTASSFVLCLDAYMTGAATSRLADLQSQLCEPTRINLRTRLMWALFPRGLGKLAHTLTPRDKVLVQLTSWRSKLETLFSRYFLGRSHSRRRIENEPSLPAVEVFVLTGGPAKEQDLDEWIVDTRVWWNSLGFDFFFSAFRSRGLIFSWGTINRWFPSSAHRLVFLPESFRDSHHESLHTESHINREFEEDLDNLTPLITIWYYIEVVRKRVSKLKLMALKKMQANWWSWFWPRMGPLIKLSSDIQQEAMLIDRLSLEWGARSKQITESQTRHDSMMSLLKYRSVLGMKEEERENLRDAPLKIIGQQIENLNRQLSHLRTWYAEHLNSRNTWVTYRLTVVLGIATFVGLISLRSEFKSLWEAVARLLKTVFHTG